MNQLWEVLERAFSDMVAFIIILIFIILAFAGETKERKKDVLSFCHSSPFDPRNRTITKTGSGQT
jgi:hypothetical protein